MSSPIRNTLAANHSDAYTPAAPATIASAVCHRGGGVDEARRSMMTKLLIGGTNDNATASVESGSRLKITGEGEQGPNGGTRGDLYVVIHVQNHPNFEPLRV